MTQPADLIALRAHLDSRDPRVRAVALVHVGAHGAAARDLAPRVARALEDPDPTVQYEAMGAFRRVGRDSDAAPTLLALLDREAPVAMLRTRAMYCLGVVGPAARGAIPTLIALLESADRRDAIEALIAVTDEPDERVAEVTLAALFDEESDVVRSLSSAAPWLAARAFDLAEARLDSEEHGSSAIAVIDALKQHDPARATALRHRAILAQGPASGLAVVLLEQNGEPVPLDVARAILALGRAGRPAVYETFARCADRLPQEALAQEALAAEARADLVPRILAPETELRPLQSYVIGLAALAPGEASVVPTVLGRLAAGMQAQKPLWYPLGGIARAVSALADAGRADEVASALEAALAHAKAHLGRDRSAVLDFQRRVKSGLTAFAALSERARAVLARPLEVDRVDAAHAAADERVPTLPEIPVAREVVTRAQVRAPNAAERAELARARALGAAWTKEQKLARAAKPAKIVAVVDAAVGALADHPERAAALVPALAALYGDALVAARGWSWKLYSEGDLRALAVVAPDDAYALLPGKMISAKIAPAADVTLLLLFNMLAAGNVPPSKRGALTRLG